MHVWFLNELEGCNWWLDFGRERLACSQKLQCSRLREHDEALPAPNETDRKDNLAFSQTVLTYPVPAMPLPINVDDILHG